MNFKLHNGRMAEWQKVKPKILQSCNSAILQFMFAFA